MNFVKMHQVSAKNYERKKLNRILFRKYGEIFISGAVSNRFCDATLFLVLIVKTDYGIDFLDD